MPRGRPPKPDALKALGGYPGHRPPGPNAVQLECKAPRCPKWLSKDARKIFRRMCKELKELRTIATIDQGAIVMYAVLAARFQEAEAGVRKSGLIVKDEKGRPRVSPYVKICNDCIAQLLRISTEFGLTPASRGRIHAIPPAPASEDTEAAAEARRMQIRLFGTE